MTRGELYASPIMKSYREHAHSFLRRATPRLGFPPPVVFMFAISAVFQGSNNADSQELRVLAINDGGKRPSGFLVT